MNASNYLEDASGYTGFAEKILVPRDESELLDSLSQGMPVTISGGGTGLTGGRVAQGGW